MIQDQLLVDLVDMFHFKCEEMKAEPCTAEDGVILDCDSLDAGETFGNQSQLG